MSYSFRYLVICGKLVYDVLFMNASYKYPDNMNFMINMLKSFLERFVMHVISIEQFSGVDESYYVEYTHM